MSTNILEEWLGCLSSAKVIVVANPASLYPCAPEFLKCKEVDESEKSSFTLLPYVFSQSPRLRLSPVERSKTLGLRSRPKPLSQTLVIKPLLIEVTA